MSFLNNIIIILFSNCFDFVFNPEKVSERSLKAKCIKMVWSVLKVTRPRFYRFRAEDWLNDISTDTVRPVHQRVGMKYNGYFPENDPVPSSGGALF